MATTNAAGTSSRTDSAASDALRRRLSATGAGKSHPNPPDRGLAGQTGGGAGDAATRRLEVVSLPPPPRRLTKAQKEALALAAALAADKAVVARRHQRYIQGKAASLGVTVEEAETIAQAENAQRCALAQQKFADSRTRESRPSEYTVWTDNEGGWITITK